VMCCCAAAFLPKAARIRMDRAHDRMNREVLNIGVFSQDEDECPLVKRWGCL
jgi:hypothetical protein